MTAKTVEELLVYQKARRGVAVLAALIEDHPSLAADRTLAGQLDKGAVRVKSDIAEGFEQKTDRAFARYLYDARGGAQEIRSQLEDAVIRRKLTAEQAHEGSELYLEIAKMLSGFIRHLEREDRRHRRQNGEQRHGKRRPRREPPTRD